MAEGMGKVNKSRLLTACFIYRSVSWMSCVKIMLSIASNYEFIHYDGSMQFNGYLHDDKIVGLKPINVAV
jgi:hypothetical protein